MRPYSDTHGIFTKIECPSMISSTTFFICPRIGIDASYLKRGDGMNFLLCHYTWWKWLDVFNYFWCYGKWEWGVMGMISKIHA
jgi:hypothetical protein